VADPNDDAIIAEVREGGHAWKQRFDADRLSRALTWMRGHGLAQRGAWPSFSVARK
jgi:hypothetical protein